MKTFENEMSGENYEELKPSNWDLYIERVGNGYIVTTDDYINVFQFKDDMDEDDELQAHKDLLLHVLDHFGVYYNKHAKKNLRVIIEDQDGKEIED